MGKGLFTLFVPPMAVYRYGCAGYCAAPIGVFWIAGIASLVYSLEGGPVGNHETNWVIVELGIVLWAIASAWTWTTIERTQRDQGGVSGQNKPGAG